MNRLDTGLFAAPFAALFAALLASGLGGCAMTPTTAIVLELDTEDPVIASSARSFDVQVRSGADLDETDRRVIDGELMPFELLLEPADAAATQHPLQVDIVLYDGPGGTGREVSRRGLDARYEMYETTWRLVVFE